MVTALPTIDRLLELRETITRSEFVYLDARLPAHKNELLALLEAALAVRETEKWLRDAKRVELHCDPMFGDFFVMGSPAAHGPDLLTALRRALDEATKKT
jgi:hypothetical protein